jgi:hypothetical protein
MKNEELDKVKELARTVAGELQGVCRVVETAKILQLMESKPKAKLSKLFRILEKIGLHYEDFEYSQGVDIQEVCDFLLAYKPLTGEQKKAILKEVNAIDPDILEDYYDEETESYNYEQLKRAILKHKQQQGPDFTTFHVTVKEDKDGNEKKSYKLIPHHENTKVLLDYLGIKNLRFNRMTKDINLIVPELDRKNVDKSNIKDVVLTYILDEAKRWNYTISESMVARHIQLLGAANAYHPVAEWIDKTPWDGVDRLQEVIDCINVVPEHKNALDMYMRKFMVGAVAAIYKSNDLHWRGTEGVMIFMGDEGLGKTSFWMELTKCGERVYQDGLSLGDASDRDSKMAACKYWISELGEIEGVFRRKGNSAIKNFITASRDELRKPYDRGFSEYPRNFVMTGTVNEEEFLGSETNRRYWAVKVVRRSNKERRAFDIDRLAKIDKQQVWAQVKQMMNDGYVYWLETKEETTMHKMVNGDFTSVLPHPELAMGVIFDPNKFPNHPYEHREKMNATFIFKYLGISPSKIDNNGLVKELNRKGFERDSRKNYDVAFVKGWQHHVGQAFMTNSIRKPLAEMHPEWNGTPELINHNEDDYEGNSSDKKDSFDIEDVLNNLFE